MAYEYTPPKYAQVIGEVQRRIEGGEYPPGSLLPSEHQLSAEFGIARPTVVRALRVLRQEGWIDTQQGRGSFVRGRPALAGVAAERRGLVELDRDESRESGELVTAGTAPAPAPCTAASAPCWPGRRACGLITSSSRSPRGAPPRMRRSCWASPGPRRSWRCTSAPARQPAAPCSSWTSRCPATPTSWKTPTPSASLSRFLGC